MASGTETNGFEQFCTNVRQMFSDKTLKTADRHESLKELMSSCNFAKEDWQNYAKFDPTVNYSRNLVDDGGEESLYNILILCWNPQKGSPIHDHAESSCFLQVLDGKLEEVKYEVPTEGEQLKLKQSAVHRKGTLTFMDNSVGLHKITNPEESEGAVSLHLYYPPLNTCLKYDEAGNSMSCDIKVN